MDDYYSLLGIDADASVDDIRGAYRVRKDGLDTASEAGRADAAKLNKAWNVLSDPYQRGRYDEQRTAAADSDDARFGRRRRSDGLELERVRTQGPAGEREELAPGAPAVGARDPRRAVEAGGDDLGARREPTSPSRSSASSRW